MEFAADSKIARVAQLEAELAELKLGLNTDAVEFTPTWGSPTASTDTSFDNETNNAPTLGYEDYADEVVNSLLGKDASYRSTTVSSSASPFDRPHSTDPTPVGMSGGGRNNYNNNNNNNNHNRKNQNNNHNQHNHNQSNRDRDRMHPLASSIDKNAARPPGDPAWNNSNANRTYDSNARRSTGNHSAGNSPSRSSPSLIHHNYEQSESTHSNNNHRRYDVNGRGYGYRSDNSYGGYNNDQQQGNGSRNTSPTRNDRNHGRNNNNNNNNNYNRNNYENGGGSGGRDQGYGHGNSSNYSNYNDSHNQRQQQHQQHHQHSYNDVSPFENQKQSYSAVANTSPRYDQQQQQQQQQQQYGQSQHAYHDNNNYRNNEHRHRSSPQSYSPQSYSPHSPRSNRSPHSPTSPHSSSSYLQNDSYNNYNQSSHSHMDASGNPYGNPYDNMDQHETSHLSWMEKIFAINLRNDKDWRNFKNVQKHLSAATSEEIQICFELSSQRIMDMAYDDKENHVLQELIENFDETQLEAIFKFIFDEYRVEQIMTHPRANHVVQKYLKRVPPALLTKCVDVLTMDSHRLDKIACNTIGNNVYQTAIKLCGAEDIGKMCTVLLKDDIIIHMAKNQFGLCVIRCLFQNMVTTDASTELKKRLLFSWNDLCYLKYGNLTAQFLLSTCMDNDDVEQVDLVNTIRTMAKHPHANHVVQRLCSRIATSGTTEQKNQIISATSLYFVNLATSQYGSFVVECVLKHFDPQLTLPMMDMLCSIEERPTNLCKIASTQYGTQFLQKFMDVADESQLKMLDHVLRYDLVDIMICSSYSGHFLMKMMKSRASYILKSDSQGVQRLARDMGNLSSNERSSHVLQMILDDNVIWFRLEPATRTLLATAISLNLVRMVNHRLSLHVVCKLYKIVFSHRGSYNVEEGVLLKSLDQNFMNVMNEINGTRLTMTCLGCEHSGVTNMLVRKCIQHMDILLPSLDSESCIIGILKGLDKGKCGCGASERHELCVEMCDAITPHCHALSTTQNGKHLIVRMLNMTPNTKRIGENNEYNKDEQTGSLKLMHRLLPMFVSLSCDWHGNHVIQSLIDNVRKSQDARMWHEISELIDMNYNLLNENQYGKHVLKAFTDR